MAELLSVTDCGLYCADGDFYVDPWRPVGYAVITHVHSDRSGIIGTQPATRTLRLRSLAAARLLRSG